MSRTYSVLVTPGPTANSRPEILVPTSSLVYAITSALEIEHYDYPWNFPGTSISVHAMRSGHLYGRSAYRGGTKREIFIRTWLRNGVFRNHWADLRRKAEYMEATSK